MPAGSVNPRPASRRCGAGYAPATINHALSVLSASTPSTCTSAAGPVINPVPETPAPAGAAGAPQPAGAARRAPARLVAAEGARSSAPRSIPDRLWDELFAADGMRPRPGPAGAATCPAAPGQRAARACAAGARRLGRPAVVGDLQGHPAAGAGARVRRRRSPTWRAYLDQARHCPSRTSRSGGPCAGEPRPLTYWAMRRVMQRANAVLGTNWTLHDIRHTAATRMAGDPALTLVGGADDPAAPRISARPTRYTAVRAGGPDRQARRALHPAAAGSACRRAMTPTTSRRCSVPVVPLAQRAGTGRRPDASERNPRAEAPRTGRSSVSRRAAARPANPPRPLGDLRPGRRWTRSPTWPRQSGTTRPDAAPSRGRSMRDDPRTTWRGFPGTTWQQRWVAAGLDERGRPVRDLAGEDKKRAELTQALEALFCLRVIRPIAGRVPLATHFTSTTPRLPHRASRPAAGRVLRRGRRRRRDAALQARGAVRRLLRADRARASPSSRPDAGGVAALRASQRTRSRRGRQALLRRQLRGHLAWHVLHEMGHFPPSAPPPCGPRYARASEPSSRTRRPARSSRNTECATCWSTTSPPRDDLDYSSLSAAGHGCWSARSGATIEKINPDQADLRLTEDTYHAVEGDELQSCRGRAARGWTRTACSLAVRALYFDLQAWAAARARALGGLGRALPDPGCASSALVQRRRGASTSGWPTAPAACQPLLPLLVEHVDQPSTRLAELLDRRPRPSSPASDSAVGARGYRACSPQRSRPQAPPRTGRTSASGDQATGELVNVTRAEDTAFWDWAVVETLRHSRPADRGTARADPPQHPPIPASQRRGRRPPGHHPVQDRPRAGHPDVRRAVPRHRLHHPPAPQRPTARSRWPPATTFMRRCHQRPAALPVPDARSASATRS